MCASRHRHRASLTVAVSFNVVRYGVTSYVHGLCHCFKLRTLKLLFPSRASIGSCRIFDRRSYGVTSYVRGYFLPLPQNANS